MIRLMNYTWWAMIGKFFSIKKEIFPLLPFYPIILPFTRIQKKMEKWIEKDWNLGLYNTEQILIYKHHIFPVSNAINNVLANATPHTMLPKIANLINYTYGWALIRFGSASLGNQLRNEAIDAFFLLPSRWKQRWKSKYPTRLRLDTPARAACAGFWLWHKKEVEKAVNAFAVVKEFPHGPELYGIANSIFFAQQADVIKTIMNWEKETQWLESLPHSELRPGTLQTLRLLRSVSAEASVVVHAQAPLLRATAIGRANAILTRLIETNEPPCPEPEWPLIKEIAEEWRGIFAQAGGIIGDEVLRQPVLNPYEGYSGLPVTGTTFMGRDDIMRRIESHWATPGQLVAIILYGHRRMGKTSILRNLANCHGNNILYVYLDMQNVSIIDHTGQLFLDIAEVIYSEASQAGFTLGSAPDPTAFTTMGTGRRALNALFDTIATQMTPAKRLVLAIDEFERIETGIQQQKIDPAFLDYLRSINQKYSWLGLIFAGLHTLDELGRDYQSAFLGQAEYIRVGYMEYKDALRLITQPHPDFALEYDPELREELFHLSAGQPYLLQRLCWELVTRWNERFMAQGETTPRIIPLSDLEPILTPDFFLSAGYYFDGVWSNVTENERHLMSILANNANCPCSLAQLAEAVAALPSFHDPAALEHTLALLRRHDVIVETPEGLRITSELMRRWIRIKEGC